MGLPRLIILALLVAGGVWLWRRFNQRSNSSTPPSPVQKMVCCAHCHVHLPQDRALADSPYWYCSSQHQQQGPKARD